MPATQKSVCTDSVRADALVFSSAWKTKPRQNQPIYRTSFLGQTTSAMHPSSVRSSGASDRRPIPVAMNAIPVALADTDRMVRCTETHSHYIPSGTGSQPSLGRPRKQAMRAQAVAGSKTYPLQPSALVLLHSSVLPSSPPVPWLASLAWVLT